MAWFNPLSWGRKAGELTLDQLVRRLAIIQNTAADVTVTPETALESPTVFAIVNALAKTLAHLPVDVIEKSGNTRRQLPDHEVAWLLNHRPNQWQTRYDYWFTVATRLLLRGEAIQRKVQVSNGRIMNLIPLAPEAVSYRQREDFTLEYNNGGEILNQTAVHHIRSFTVDGVTAVSPIDRIRESIALEIAAERFGAAFFGNGAIPNIVLKRPDHFRDEESLKRFAKSWRESFRKKRGTAILEDGMDVVQLQISNAESQFLELRKYQRTVIAGAYGIPPHRIGDLDRATFSNVEHQGLEFVVYCLTPMLVAIESAIERDLLPANQRGRVQVKFNVDALLRGDLKSRSEALRIQREQGVISANEWREIEDRNPRTDPGGDEYLTPVATAQRQEEPAKDGNESARAA